MAGLRVARRIGPEAGGDGKGVEGLREQRRGRARPRLCSLGVMVWREAGVALGGHGDGRGGGERRGGIGRGEIEGSGGRSAGDAVVPESEAASEDWVRAQGGRRALGGERLDVGQGGVREGEGGGAWREGGNVGHGVVD